MDYSRIYEHLIDKFRNEKTLGYSESHHIVPRCLGGGNEPENLVDLPARYHFVAHLLLAKIHGGRLIHAAWMMTNMKRYTSRHYQWVKTRYIASITGVTRSPEYCAKMSEATSGENNYWHGKKLSEEHKSKLRKPKTITPKVLAARQAIKGKPRSEEHRRKISEGLKGRIMSPEAIAKSVATRRKNGYVHSEETKAKMCANHADFSGTNHPQYGKKQSSETIAKAVETRRKNGSYGFSPDALKKAAEARRNKRLECKLNELARQHLKPLL